MKWNRQNVEALIIGTINAALMVGCALWLYSRSHSLRVLTFGGLFGVLYMVAVCLVIYHRKGAIGFAQEDGLVSVAMMLVIVAINVSIFGASVTAVECTVFPVCIGSSETYLELKYTAHVISAIRAGIAFVCAILFAVANFIFYITPFYNERDKRKQ